MALLSVIRRWHLRDEISIREIARRTKLSRNTITKYLASGDVSPRYPIRKRSSQLDPYAAHLSRRLRANQQVPRKQRHTIRWMYQALAAQGYVGSYGRVAAFARAWRQAEQERSRTAGRGTFVPLAFAPGEAFQFDWSEDSARIGGERVKLQVAQFKLCHNCRTNRPCRRDRRRLALRIANRPCAGRSCDRHFARRPQTRTSKSAWRRSWNQYVDHTSLGHGGA